MFKAMIETLKNLTFYFVIAVLPVSAALFKVWVHQDAVRLGYALNAEEKRGNELRQQLTGLQAELAMMHSPSRLSAKARHLALIAPEPEQLTAGIASEQNHRLANNFLMKNHATP